MSRYWSGNPLRARRVRGTFGKAGKWFRAAIGQTRRPRYLINEILLVQLLVTTLVGMLAVLGLYWGTQWSLQSSYERWAMSWTDDLNALGSPLYVPHDNRALREIERYVGKYEEIELVSYYRDDGALLLSVGHSGSAPAQSPDLDAATVADVAAVARSDRAYVLEGTADARRFRIVAPIWTEALTGDGLYHFDPSRTQHDVAATVVGFVVLDLDFSWYYEQLLSNVRIAVAVILVLLIAAWLNSRMLLRSSLKPLADLREPIEALGQGNLSVRFDAAAHREISTVVDALTRAAAALSERDTRLRQLANHDPLTNLYNRSRFVSALNEELQVLGEQAHGSALYFIDFDQFKYVNDTCGYLAGDEFLRQIGNELRFLIDDGSVLGRLGGDEFAVLTRNVTPAEATSLGDRIVEQMRRVTFVDEGVVFYAQCSIGLVMIEDGELGADDLISRADLACRDAKSRGRNRLQVFSVADNTSEQLTADVGWAERLRTALDGEGFVLLYQPIVHIKTGCTTHHEVLLRLRDDRDRLVSPDAFLPAARRFGLMAEIDHWVVKHALQELARFSTTKPESRFTINLSAAAFDSAAVAELVGRQLKLHGVAASSVVFEITEQVALRHLRQARSQVKKLRALGCGIAIDDFGTGYSSFSQLKHLPVDYIKIDGGFVKDILKDAVDRTMVRVIGEIGRAAKMQTIAEYVTSVEAIPLLAELGIDYAQGYAVGKPAATPVWKTIAVPFRATGGSGLRNRDRTA
ncbi:MAG: EAL domain-containing protein [Pseudomonadota bacterium]